MKPSEIELEVTNLVSYYPEADTLESPVLLLNHSGQQQAYAAAAQNNGLAARAYGPGPAAQQAVQAVKAIAQGRLRFLNQPRNNSQIAPLRSEPTVNELMHILKEAMEK
jgi:hypothetical protein